MNEKELLCRMALPLLPGIGLVGARHLIQAAGSATMLFEHARELPALLPGVTPKVATAFQHTEVFRLCEAELSFAQKHQIQCLTEDDEAYPSRLRECPDGPLVLFYKGSANLNNRHILSIVGTRNAIDIHAHREALTHGFDTVGVLAHGLDRIYPAVHRRTATEMLTQGGLLTEFMSGTNPDRQNFVKRNRIVAGISDATLVVESGPKGGSLITAEIAESYQRDCFAFPGRVGDTYSTGCNLLIQKNRAALIQGAEDVVKAMNWDHVPISPQVVQRQLFPELTPEEEQVITHLQKHPDGIQINTLVVESNIAINRMTSLLFNLEMKGVVRALAGGVYKMA